MQVAVSDEDGLAPNVFVMCQHATLMHFAAIFGFSAVFLLCLFLFLSVLCWVFLAMSLDPLPACPGASRLGGRGLAPLCRLRGLPSP